MLALKHNIALKEYNTFAVEASAANFYVITSVDDLLRDLNEIRSYSPRLVLGGGSNLLFIEDYSGLILYPQLFGIELISETVDSVSIKVGASENWHQFVEYCITQGWYGLENLALIPGTVGAAPVQNIGAYGVEIEAFIERVAYVDLESGQMHWRSGPDCEFDYRDSYFKHAKQGQYLITQVEFKLLKQPAPCLTYQPLAEYFADKSTPTPKQVMQRVCEIRQQKLPNPVELANAGSFFKNPIVSAEKFATLKKQFPHIVAYPAGEEFKLAAGWLIEKAGLKGKQIGDIGIHKKQALVLVNYAEVNGKKIWQLARLVQDKVLSEFGVLLEPEVRVIGRLD